MHSGRRRQAGLYLFMFLVLYSLWRWILMAGYWCSRVPDLEADIQIDVPRLVSLETCFTFVVCCEPRSFKACSKSGSISHRVKTLLRNPNAAH